MPALICASSALVGKTTTRPPGMVKVLALELNGVFDITFYLSLISKIGGVFVRVKGDFHSNFYNYV